MKLSKIMLALSAVALLSVMAEATGANSSLSGEVTLDTRTKATALNGADEGIDTRSYTEAWSAESALNTKKIVGTMFLIR